MHVELTSTKTCRISTRNEPEGRLNERPCVSTNSKETTVLYPNYESFHGNRNVERIRERHIERENIVTIKEKKMHFETTVLIFALNALWAACQAVPLIDLKSALEQNVLQNIVTSACSSNGECWGWLPAEEVPENVTPVPDNLPMPKLHIRRQTSNIDPNTVIESWDDNASTLARKFHPVSPITRQIGNGLSKKDVFMSRSWGAGGMPFSVLYMSPHGPRGNHASTTQQETGKTTESSTPSLAHPNYRVALRNGGASTQPRRQYSIIPQLFISYGWGQFGK